MTPSTILLLIIVYFGTLFYISHRVSRKDSGNEAFFTANKNSKWYLVAFGMIGTALSGVTFISVPGEVGAPSGEQFKYFQFVLGNALGFIVITKLLLPLYYRMNLTSIYGYIEQRMGFFSYKTASFYFPNQPNDKFCFQIVFGGNCFTAFCIRFLSCSFCIYRFNFAVAYLFVHLQRRTKNDYYYRYSTNVFPCNFCFPYYLFYLR